jgi:hypothetical protein
MQKVFDNLINGNLSDAKLGAKRFGLFKLALFIRDNSGLSRNASIMAASYLKGRCTFQTFCDAK